MDLAKARSHYTGAMRRVTVLLLVAGCATPHRTRDPYARAFEACYDAVRAHSCTAATAPERDACMEQLGLRYDGAGSRGKRRALLLDGGCPAAVVGAELDR